MFAYCANNPISRTDSSGTFYRSIGSNISTVCFSAPGQRGTALARLQRQAPEFDGEFALYENTEYCCNGDLTAQLLAGNLSLPGITEDGVSLGGMDVSMIRCTWKDENVEVAFGNMLNANISAGVSWTGGGALSAMVSAWSPSITFITDIGRITVTVDIAAAGVELKLGQNGVYGFNVATGGGGFGISWER